MLTRTDLYTFQAQCLAAEVTPPAAILRAIDQLEIAATHELEQRTPALDLTPEQIRTRLFETSVRAHQGFQQDTLGLRPGLEQFEADVLAEVHAAVLPELDLIVEEMRPKFDAVVAPLILAAQTYGFTYATKSDDVIDMADEGASAAWRDQRDAWAAVSPFARFRISMSKLFDVSPSREDAAEAARRAGIYDRTEAHPLFEDLNYSVCFAAADNWSPDDGYYLQRDMSRLRGGSIDWLALAAGGLHLNTPTEVQQKLTDRERAQAGTR